MTYVQFYSYLQVNKMLEPQAAQARAVRNDHFGYYLVGFFTETLKEKLRNKIFVISFLTREAHAQHKLS